jgi:hypothetical protein
MKAILVRIPGGDACAVGHSTLVHVGCYQTENAESRGPFQPLDYAKTPAEAALADVLSDAAQSAREWMAS